MVPVVPMKLADSPRAGTPAHTGRRMLPAAGLRAMRSDCSSPELQRPPGTLWLKTTAIEGVRQRYTLLDASDDNGSSKAICNSTKIWLHVGQHLLNGIQELCP